MPTRLAPDLLALITALVAMGVASMALYVPSLPAFKRNSASPRRIPSAR